jgi:restriction system protein
MGKQKESVAELLLKAPWWVSAAVAGLSFAGLRWVFPAVIGQDKLLQAFAAEAAKLAYISALLFALLAAGSALFATKRRRLVDDQQSLESLCATSWKDFEYLVAEAYRRQGFDVDYSLGEGSDGGVDLVLRKDGRKVLVQCKQWKTFSVGRPVVQQMFGIMTAERADEVILITSGRFTNDAREFAHGKPVRLVDGAQLLELVRTVQASKAGPAPVEIRPAPAAEAPRCPLCGSEMVQRTARRGVRAGSNFWGCASYPKCKGTRSDASQ